MANRQTSMAELHHNLPLKICLAFKISKIQFSLPMESTQWSQLNQVLMDLRHSHTFTTSLDSRICLTTEDCLCVATTKSSVYRLIIRLLSTTKSSFRRSFRIKTLISFSWMRTRVITGCRWTSNTPSGNRQAINECLKVCVLFRNYL